MILPMFPLQTVVFPFTAVPLRVFESRYQMLLDRVMTVDGRFGIVLIERGQETGGGDTRHSVGTLVKVASIAAIPNSPDRAIVVAGHQRIRILSWLVDDPYPRAVVEEDPDPDPGPSVDLQPALGALRRLLALASELGADVAGIGLELADDSLAASYQLAALCPVTSFDSQRLLEAVGASARLDLARSLLDDRAELLLLQLSSQ
ncbi:MAG TPA: LON peptidase substrate-binding domain-containing protein [Acidimicrobiia bacterium]|nr:LON peptidase substrate-binding domain-containing protein [Acidimicrobiia bacterium]